MADVLLLVLFGVVIAFEAVAHFVFHNNAQMETVSNEVRTWEGRSHRRRVAVLGALTVVWVLLILHLVVKLF